MHSTALVSGVVFSIVYFGNIVGAVKSSQSLNANHNETISIKLRFEVFPELKF